jgi:molecular chaperone DnaK (HSP70)
MRLGIDFGTTRIVVAAVDRGNYPVVSFEAPGGEACDWFPPLIAAREDERRYGWAAWEVGGDPGWTLVRSIKRALAEAGPETRVQLGPVVLPMHRLLAELMAELRRHLLASSTLTVKRDEPLETILGVPANANGNQRFLTTEAFRAAGFEVLGLLNEPTAAGVEFVHGGGGRASGASRLLVYDLGGGTFDASLVDLRGRDTDVVASAGIPTLGGDEFDQALADLALEAAWVNRTTADGLDQAEMFRLLEECRRRKEALHPNSRSLIVDLGVVRDGWSEVRIPTAAYFERCRPAVDETLHAVHDVVAAEPAAEVDAVYATGGGSELPLVSRALREVFGRRLRRSPYSRSAVAIGLAIRADEQSGYVLRERFSRSFGVWREADGGRSVAMDELFARDTVLPGPDEPPLVRTRRYRPVHNVGHFRYLECSRRDPDGRPVGDITLWDEIRFPFDPELRDREDLGAVPVEHSARAATQDVEERYACDASGNVAVEIANTTSDYAKTYRLARWAPAQPTLVPGRKRRTAAKPRAKKPS